MSQIIMFITEEMDRKAYVPYKKVINTKANLSFEVLKEIFFIYRLGDRQIRFKGRCN